MLRNFFRCYICWYPVHKNCLSKVLFEKYSKSIESASLNICVYLFFKPIFTKNWCLHNQLNPRLIRITSFGDHLYSVRVDSIHVTMWSTMYYNKWFWLDSLNTFSKHSIIDLKTFGRINVSWLRDRYSQFNVLSYISTETE